MEETKSAPPWRALLAGALGGSTEPLTGQPLWTLTKRLQSKDPNAWRRAGLYTGLRANVLSVGPTTAVQWAVKSKLPGDGLSVSFFAGWLAGVTVAGPTEQGITLQQGAQKGTGFVKANRAYLAKRGLMATWEGALVTGTRDGIFTVGMFSLRPRLETVLRTRCHARRLDPTITYWLPLLAAGSASGALAAVISHPFATISQRQRGRDHRVNSWKALCEILDEAPQGKKLAALFEGWKPRAARAAIALVTIPTVAECILKLTEERS